MNLKELVNEIGPDYRVVYVELAETFTNCVPAIKKKGWFKPVLIELLPLNGKIQAIVRHPDGHEVLEKLKKAIGEEKFHDR